MSEYVVRIQLCQDGKPQSYEELLLPLPPLAISELTAQTFVAERGNDQYGRLRERPAGHG